MKTASFATTIATALLASTAHAALLDRSGGLLYDNVTHLTWTQDANLAKTQHFGVSGINANGQMNWQTAQAWITAMNAANYGGYNDWRLPTVSPVNGSAINDQLSFNGSTDRSYNISSQASELGYMYYQNLNAKAYYTSAGVTQSGYGVLGNGIFNSTGDVGLVDNIVSASYWSGTVLNANPSYSWSFDENAGHQQYYGQGNLLYVWAVRVGDVSAQVPEPAALSLLLSTLALLSLHHLRRLSQNKDLVGRISVAHPPSA